MLYVNSNGDLLKNDGPTIRASNRGYLYGDGVFESIRIIKGRAINLDNHVKRMLGGAEKLKIRVPSYLNLEFFESKIEELISKSKIEVGGRCRISLDRSTGGGFKPESNQAEYFIEVYPLDRNHFELNPKGLEIDLYQDMRKEKTTLSNYKTKNGLIYIMAAIAAQEKKLDEFLITNPTGGIVEGTSSNVFVVSNGVLYTPGLDEGCLAGTMRMQIINIAIASGIKVYECSLMPQNLLVADEVFLTNAIKGVEWVSGYRTKRYFNNVSRNLISLLNEKWSK